MSNTTATALRYIDTLRCLPLGKWRTTPDVYHSLRSLGHNVTKRTVLRDLHRLAKPFGIEIVEWGGGQGHEWKRTRSLEQDLEIDLSVVRADPPVVLPFTTKTMISVTGPRTSFALRRQRSA